MQLNTPISEEYSTLETAEPNYIVTSWLNKSKLSGFIGSLNISTSGKLLRYRVKMSLTLITPLHPIVDILKRDFGYVLASN